MSLRIAKHVAGLFVVCSLIAWSGARASGAADCCNMLSRCSQMTDAEILAAAYLAPGATSTHFGMCYYHDRSACPSCALDFYIKESYLPPPSGYDGGTGGLPLGSTLSDVARILRQLCENGSCCCPQKTPTSSCPSLGIPVWAKDPITKSCCQYSNSCQAPSGWAQYSSQADCEGWKPASVE